MATGSPPDEAPPLPPSSPADPASWLLLCRTVRFGDTDAAGVMHFHQLLRWCHEAYEESLERFGLAPAEVFPRPVWGNGIEGLSEDAAVVAARPATALPIVHCSADYLRPLRVGDPLAIALQPSRLDPALFEVRYSFRSEGALVARGLTRHLAIRASDRQRCGLPESIHRWLEASGLGCGIREV
ncbi:MAG: thioesterase family protein [Cyanobacteriota bacterium]|nr:thioesterase family protein [Cyanobacteriota bacterium]